MIEENKHQVAPAISQKVIELSEDDIFLALDNEDPAIIKAMTDLIGEYSEKAAGEMQKGGDYLSVLAVDEKMSGLARVAVQIVREVFDEELEDV